MTRIQMIVVLTLSVFAMPHSREPRPEPHISTLPWTSPCAMVQPFTYAAEIECGVFVCWATAWLPLSGPEHVRRFDAGMDSLRALQPIKVVVSDVDSIQ